MLHLSLDGLGTGLVPQKPPPWRGPVSVRRVLSAETQTRPSVVQFHRDAGVVHRLSSRDLEDAVAEVGGELLAVEAVGEAKAAAPGAAAELAHQNGCRIVGRRAFGADHQIAVGGFDVDGVPLDTG